MSTRSKIYRNMPLLWTFYDRPEAGLPKTNNTPERLLSDLKTKVRVRSARYCPSHHPKVQPA